MSSAQKQGDPMRDEHFIKQHMLNIRNGIKVSFQVPTKTTYHKPTVAPDYSPALPSLGNRQPAAKSPYNWRGTQPSLDGKHFMYFESSLELKAGRIFRADRDYVEIREQWPTVKYQGEDGKVHSHTFDYFVRDKNGLRILVPVKPAAKIAKSGLVKILRRIHRAGISEFADKISIVTEAFANDEANANAEWVLLSRRNRNDNEFAAARAFVAGMTGPMRFWDMLTPAPEMAHRRTAIWNLIDEKILKPVKPGLIDDTSLLAKAN
jgi:hypothetical protein